MIRKLKFKYGHWRPSWIYANKKNCPKLPFGNQTKFVQLPYTSTNPSENFIGTSFFG